MTVIELHIIQNFAPSNLNRDDTGAPKDCTFGGYPRARISSQALKRAMRTAFEQGDHLPPENLAVRTKRVAEQLAKRLQARGKQPEEAVAVARNVVTGLGMGLDGEKTEYLLFLGNDALDRLARVSLEQWDALAALDTSAKGKKTEVPKPLKDALLEALHENRAADVALFGRMLADLTAENVDAASQVAHAISTHEVTPEFDFYTAVDDLNPEDTAGAGMMGTVEFNSACYYRYANVDVDQLQANLDGDLGLTQRTLIAFLDAAIHAAPSGKQNTFAAHNLPSLVMAVVREKGFANLANAFLNPVKPKGGKDLVQASIEQLMHHRGQLVSMYGAAPGEESWVASTEATEVPAAQRVPVAELIRGVVSAATGAGA